MPTSKDIIKDAEKVIKENAIAKMAIDDVVKQGRQDTAAYAKARAELATSIASMSNTVKIVEEKVKSLNGGLTALKKNEPVMKAPADAKQYQSLVKTFTQEIKEGMKHHKNVGDTLKKAEEIAKKR